MSTKHEAPVQTTPMGLGSSPDGREDSERALIPGFAPAHTGSCRPQDTTVVSSTEHGPASCHVPMPCSHQGSSAITQLDLIPDRGNCWKQGLQHKPSHQDLVHALLHSLLLLPTGCPGRALTLHPLALRMPCRELCPPGHLQPGFLSCTPAAHPSHSTPHRRHPSHQ